MAIFGSRELRFFCTWYDQFICHQSVVDYHTNNTTFKIFIYGKETVGIFRVIWGWKLFWTKKQKDSLGEFLTELNSTENKITVRNIAKFWRGGIYNLKLQSKILQNSQEVEFITHKYMHKYCKIIKWHNL